MKWQDFFTPRLTIVFGQDCLFKKRPLHYDFSSRGGITYHRFPFMFLSVEGFGGERKRVEIIISGSHLRSVSLAKYNGTRNHPVE